MTFYMNEIPPLFPSMKSALLALLAICFFAPIETSLAERPTLPQWKKRRSGLDKIHIVDEFRIYYTLQGDDALPKTQDLNKNSIPDQIENLALQLTTARDLYTDVFKLRHPLESPRYKDEAEFIDVHVGALPLSTPFNPDKIKGNGSAGDAAINYYRPSDPEAGITALTIDISRKLDTSNLSPAHELFHLFQYGYTMFKGSWFTEGTARWTESAFRKGSGHPTELPLTKSDQEKLFALSYDAEGFWSKLAQTAYPRDRLDVPADLLRHTYIGSKERIIRDEKFLGASLLKPLLEALDAADDRVTAELKLKTFGWPEALQRSADNNPYIWSAIVEVASEHSANSKAIQSMIQSLPVKKN